MDQPAGPLRLRADVLEWRPTHFSLTMPLSAASWFSSTDGYWHPNREAELIIETCANGLIKSNSRVILREARTRESDFMLAQLRDATLHQFHDSFVVTVRSNDRCRVFGAVGLVLSWSHAFQLFIVFATEEEAGKWYAALRGFMATQSHGEREPNCDGHINEANERNVFEGSGEEIPQNVLSSDEPVQTKIPCNGALMIRNPNGTFHKWYVIPSKYLLQTSEWQGQPSRQVVYLSAFRSRLLLQFKKFIGVSPARRIDLRYATISEEEASDTLFFIHDRPLYSDLYALGPSGAQASKRRPRRYECVAASVEEKLQWQRWFVSCGAKMMCNFESSAETPRAANMRSANLSLFSSAQETANMAPGHSAESAITGVNAGSAENVKDNSRSRLSSNETALSGQSCCAEEIFPKDSFPNDAAESFHTDSTLPASCQNNNLCTSENSLPEPPLRVPLLKMHGEREVDSGASDGSFEKAQCRESPPIPLRETEESVALRGSAGEECSKRNATPERDVVTPSSRKSTKCLADTRLSESHVITENAEYTQSSQKEFSEEATTSESGAVRDILNEMLNSNEDDISEGEKSDLHLGSLFSHGEYSSVDWE